MTGDNLKAELLPLTLSEAVDAFEADLDLNSQFGDEFNRWFCEMKRQTDCKVSSFEEESSKYARLL